MHLRIRTVALVLVVGWSLGGCGRQEDSGAKRLSSGADVKRSDGLPASFVAAAEAFKTKAGSSRFPEAEKLMDALPTCPITWMRGQKRSYDYSRPSFRLPRDELISALGPPTSIESHADVQEEFISYDLGTNGPRILYHGETNRVASWYLKVFLVDGHVVGSVAAEGRK